MQFSHSWLKTQANPNLTPDQLAHLLTMAGLEVEDPDCLNIAQADTVTGKPLQTIRFL